MDQLFFCFWTKTGEWEFAIHAENTSTKTKRHVHVRRMRGRKGEYSWNIDGRRHDEHAFPTNERDIKRAKEIAGTRLKVDPNIFTFVAAFGPDEHLYIDGPEPFWPIYPLVRVRRTGMLLISHEWTIMMTMPEDDVGT